MRKLGGVILLICGLSGCAVTGAVVSVASTAVNVVADVGTAAVKGTYKAGKAVASSLESKPEKPVEKVHVVSTSTVVAPSQPQPVRELQTKTEATPAAAVDEAKPAQKSRVDRLAGY